MKQKTMSDYNKSTDGVMKQKTMSDYNKSTDGVLKQKTKPCQIITNQLMV